MAEGITNIDDLERAVLAILDRAHRQVMYNNTAAEWLGRLIADPTEKRYLEDYGDDPALAALTEQPCPPTERATLNGRRQYAALRLATALVSHRRNGRPQGDREYTLHGVGGPLGILYTSLAAEVDWYIGYIENAWSVELDKYDS